MSIRITYYVYVTIQFSKNYREYSTLKTRYEPSRVKAAMSCSTIYKYYLIYSG